MMSCLLLLRRLYRNGKEGIFMQYINELREGDQVSEIYLCKNKSINKTKAGKTYYAITLQDKTGTIDGKIWDLTNAIEHFENLNYIKIEGQVTTFNSANQLNIKRVRVAEESEYDVAEYMPMTKKDIDEMYEELMILVDSVTNQYLSALLLSLFAKDTEFITKFKKSSAAKTMHHNFVGGLLEHSLSVAKICDFMCSLYPNMNRDLLITSALCHDIGKTDELSLFPENDYTDEGQLIGHIVKGAMMLRDRIKSIDGFPKVLEDELLHCILAHHGELEFGSPKKPSLIEAVALSHADNMDAKLEAFTALTADKENIDWLGFNRMFENNVRPTSK
jgi:3'-5' exoribonuclease